MVISIALPVIAYWIGVLSLDMNIGDPGLSFIILFPSSIGITFLLSITTIAHGIIAYRKKKQKDALIAGILVFASVIPWVLLPWHITESEGFMLLIQLSYPLSLIALIFSIIKLSQTSR